ncbi:hypothetical protein [Parasitella parasitica]|uniref:Uncharacterized protein n=2 Tax=Parasitella parasitica TaxID=35722 RepID=A0A0B7MVI7_9FUNG|nr:hypothetical protein [Parasitella parasitica]
MTMVPPGFDYDRRRSSAFDNTTDLTVLASSDQYHVRLLFFLGMENEDFSEIKSRLIDYIGVKNITDSTQKMHILRSVLRSVARIAFDRQYPSLHGQDFDGALKYMETTYNNTRANDRKRAMFEETYQMPRESPSAFFLTRLTERGSRIQMKGEDIQRKFRYGLLPEYTQHCTLNGAETYEEFYKLAQGYWRIHHEPHYYDPVAQTINTNPAVPMPAVSMPTVSTVTNLPDATGTINASVTPAPLLDVATIKKLMEDVFDEKLKDSRHNGRGYYNSKNQNSNYNGNNSSNYRNSNGNRGYYNGNIRNNYANQGYNNNNNHYNQSGNGYNGNKRFDNSRPQNQGRESRNPTSDNNNRTRNSNQFTYYEEEQDISYENDHQPCDSDRNQSKN